jgi:hypothetical protein
MQRAEFWAWPEKLTHHSESRGGTVPITAEGHWARNPVFAAEGVTAAVRRLQAAESPWKRIVAKLQPLKSPLRLPPVNFRFPMEDAQLAEIYRLVMREGTPELPRLRRAVATKKRFEGDQHYCDAHGRFFPLGKGAHGAFRELNVNLTNDDHLRWVWLNAAYRFGHWIGDQHEHFDVQRLEGEVSPPDVYCSRRNMWAKAAQSYVNVFVNDCIRDNAIFK